MATIRHDGKDIDLRELEYEQLLDLMDEITLALASCKCQLRAAIAKYRTTGERADVE